MPRECALASTLRPLYLKILDPPLLEERFEFNRVVMIYKYLHNLAPSYLQTDLKILVKFITILQDKQLLTIIYNEISNRLL